MPWLWFRNHRMEIRGEKMVGQKQLLDDIYNLIDRDKYPRFTIFIGQIGSGRKTLAKEIAKKLDLQVIQLPDVKVDTVRSMIADAYKIPYKYLYIIPNAENMSLAAKNAILKVTEEPPNNAYFIMTVQDESQLLDTIKSRGMIFHMNPYSPTEIGEYADCKDTRELEIITSICEVPGDVDILRKMDVDEFYSYVNNVVDNIAVTSGSNSFKIANKINMKDDADKYDLRLFWRIFMLICLDRIKEEPLKYAEGVKLTSQYLKDIRITGINKSALFDMWILAIREAWM